MEGTPIYQKDFVVDKCLKRLLKYADGTSEIVVVSRAVSFKERIRMNMPLVDIVEELPDSGVQDLIDCAIKFGIIGAGQAGGKIAQDFWNKGYRRIMTVNTTDQDFAGITYPCKVLMGGEYGAGKDPTVGHKAAEANREEIMRQLRDCFGTDVEWILVATSSGGGTGSGSTPVLIEIAKDFMKSINKDPKVGVIAVTPKKSEGATCQNNSKTLMANLIRMEEESQISPLIIMDNEKISKRYPKLSIANFFPTCNNTLVTMFTSFNELAAQQSQYQTLDRADYRSILASGIVVFGATAVEDSVSPSKIASSAEKNIRTALFADVTVKGAKTAGAVLLSSRALLETTPQENFDLAFQSLNRVLDTPSLLLHSGIYEGPESMTNMHLYTIVGGVKYNQ